MNARASRLTQYANERVRKVAGSPCPTLKHSAHAKQMHRARDKSANFAMCHKSQLFCHVAIAQILHRFACRLNGTSNGTVEYLGELRLWWLLLTDLFCKVCEWWFHYMHCNSFITQNSALEIQIKCTHKHTHNAWLTAVAGNLILSE